ncbi:type IV pilin protein [uncultured Clostridium sp.]|uniref:type IV pilin protein n=1 Tax=uncultured Clostridium sp. TaxID=59620 RepID=UPI002598052E|nr:prepilin-type N-terminal cleavage/methylation domain-containing protein [uncultured Clostridium sp.]
MKGLIKKVRENKKGFTLAELLVVVAIVGILVAISIPVFTAQLSKARKATNQANMRAAKAAAVAQYLTDSANSKIEYDYDISTGEASVVTGNKKATTEKTLENVDGEEKYDLFSVSIEPAPDATTSSDKDVINGASVKLYVGKKNN